MSSPLEMNHLFYDGKGRTDTTLAVHAPLSSTLIKKLDMPAY